ncbi:MAG: DNA topoisomerase III, partial [Bacteroidales bacterium]|nr:DNA topoisomerase III [Bacteroidales bacterium]
STLYRDTTFSAILKKSEEDLMADIEKLKEKAEKAGQPFDVAEALRKAEEANPGIEPIASEEQGVELLERIKNADFIVTSVGKKEGKEAPPRLFDLTSLQVECNKKFGYSADETLRLIQSLYEKKITTYPRVDTTYLSDDIYPKCANILAGLKPYEAWTAPLAGKTLIKSKKVFDNSKVTDHHAIIPTGQNPVNLTDMEKRVFDLVARRFIAVFYPDCKFSTTTVVGEADGIEFKTTGKQILDMGWRVIFAKPQTNLPDGMGENDIDPAEEERTLPTFKKGESGPHEPKLDEKWTQPPRPYTEATLLRAMETAGKFVDNDELRDALKANGIGRPSTRAAIIETLFKRHYIRKERKNLIATPTGVELIGLIHEELLKSAELTGIWEKKLREIEGKTYSATVFLEELKQMVGEVVYSVLSDNTNRRVTVVAETTQETPKEPKKKRASAPKKAKTEAKVTPAVLKIDDSMLGKACPLCGKGIIIKGKTAYGCSDWKNGCTFRQGF